MQVTILGKRWFNPREGNTYYSGRLLVDGNEVVSEQFAYGYGDHYRDELWAAAADKLDLDVERYASGGIEGPSWYCRRKGIALVVEVADVARKRDL